jgi:inner membrane protein
MASIGHIAVGLAVARAHDAGRVPPWPSMVFWSGVSLLPDVDVIGFAFGIQYGDPWGHRGATHSLLFAVAVGTVVGLAAPLFRRPAVRTAVLASLVLASHAVLDTMTDGGLGCALFWPFDLTRYFAPWRPIPVAPIGLAFFSGGGLVALTELVLFGPALVFALRPRGLHFTRATLVLLATIWIAAGWAIASTDPVRQSLIGFFLREDTAYASGFSERAFRDVAVGQSEEAVRRLVGEPVEESWLYLPDGVAAGETAVVAILPSCFVIRFANGVVVSADDEAMCTRRGIRTGMSRTDVARLGGEPSESCWRYTWSPGNQHHRVRMACFRAAHVRSVLRQWE